MSFRDWICDYRDYDTPFGDLAREVESDYYFPLTDYYDDIRDYLLKNGASNAELQTFEEAYELFDEWND